MITVIIAGGSGTRLWPLSTPDYPKHLLRIDGNKRSLLQSTYDRVKDISSRVYVVTDGSHAEHVQTQLPELSKEACIVEPGRRGTANCIVAGLASISKLQADDEPIAFVHADHHIRDHAGFAHSFAVATKLADSAGRIVLVGVEPDHPSTGFGYIQKGELFDADSYVFNVVSFKEKPPYEVARAYVESGNYLWNGGYFVASLKTFERYLQERAPALHANYQKLQRAKNKTAFAETYLGFDDLAIDYELMEKLDDLLVVPASFDWMDLGSYSDLHKAVRSDEQGNHVHGEKVELAEVQNSFVQNYSGKPLAVIGLDNVVVVNTKHGLLVARKDMAQQIGAVSKRFTGHGK